MNEQTVSTAFMQKLRQHLPEAVVFKHADLGLKGLPDCSVTYRGLTLWLEFKLLELPKGTLHNDDELLAIQKRLAAAPVQLATVTRLGKAGHALYLIFWRSAGLNFYCPITESLAGYCDNAAAACWWVEEYFNIIKEKTREETTTARPVCYPSPRRPIIPQATS